MFRRQNFTAFLPNLQPLYVFLSPPLPKCFLKGGRGAERVMEEGTWRGSGTSILLYFAVYMYEF